MSFAARFLGALILMPFLLTGIAAQLIALSDFQPAATNLSPACNLTYTTTIPNCNPVDFTSGICSGPCITSLVQISYRVYQECSAVTNDNQLLIARFLAGQGISTLCPNVVVETLSGSASATSNINPTMSSTSIRIIYDTRSSPVITHYSTSSTATMLSLPSSTLTSSSSSSKEVTTTAVIQLTSTKTLLSTITVGSSSSTTSTTLIPTSSIQPLPSSLCLRL